MKKTNFRMLTGFLMVLLMLPVFSLPAFAGGGSETAETTSASGEEKIPVTGGIEFDTEETEKEKDTQEETSEAENNDTEDGDTSAAVDDKTTADFLSLFAGSEVKVTVTEDGIQITMEEDGASAQSGTVTTNGGNLNVRTGAGMEYTVMTQLSNGTEVEVTGTDGEWTKILLPPQEGYVYSDYLEMSADGEQGSLSLDEETLSSLLELFGGSGGTALTPDGNLTLIDDLGSTTKKGKQFITLQSKNGNVFYLIIDRDDEGKETVHFLNQVDDADLMALIEEDGAETAIVCSCTKRCQAGAVNLDCKLCAKDMTECVGKEAEPEKSEEVTEDEGAEAEKEKSGGINPAVILVVLLLLGGGAAGVYFKVIKQKAKPKVSHTDDYDDSEDEEDAEDEVWETEQEDLDEADAEESEEESGDETL